MHFVWAFSAGARFSGDAGFRSCSKKQAKEQGNVMQLAVPWRIIGGGNTDRFSHVRVGGNENGRRQCATEYRDSERALYEFVGKEDKIGRAEEVKARVHPSVL